MRGLGWTQGHEDLLFACLDDDMSGTLTAEDMKSIFDIIQSKSRQKRAAQAKASWRQLRRHRMKTEEKQTHHHEPDHEQCQNMTKEQTECPQHSYS